MARAWTEVQSIATLSAMKGRSVQPGTAKFVAIAVVLMLICDQFLFGGSRPYINSAREEYARRTEAQRVLQEDPPPVPPAVVQPEDGKEFFEAPLMPVEEPSPVQEDVKKSQAAPPSIPPPAGGREKSERRVGFVPHGAPKVAIIIDDLGMDLKRSRAIMDLPAPITLAFLPYGTKTKEYAKIGKQKGHSLIIHTPMEAMDGKQNIGPGGLKEAMSGAQFDAAFGAMLASFEGYEGINNHMGSRLTADGDKMERLMKILKDQKLFFVDSKTNARSVAAGEAQMANVPFAERDIFLDHEETLDFARKALKHTEQLALRKGYAIAIGHPKDNTIAALKEWLPTLAAKGIELVPVKALLVQPNANVIAREGGEGSVGPPVKPGDDNGEGPGDDVGEVKVPVVQPSESIPAQAGNQKAVSELEVDPRLRGDAKGGEEDVASTPPPSIPDPDLPLPPPEMFPEVTPSVGEADGNGIRLDPLPEQLPAPLSPIH